MLPAFLASAYRNQSRTADSDEVERRLRAASVQDRPFPHAIIRDFLPARLFEAVRADFPTSEDGLRQVRQGRSDTGYSPHRFARSLPAPNDPQSKELQPSMRALQQVLTCERTITRFFTMFLDVVKPHLDAIRAETGSDVLPLRTSIELIYDRSGFELVPHTDGFGKVITGLLYFAEPGDPPELGTRLYEPLDPGLTSDGGRPVARDRLRQAGVAPYEPNLFLCFARSGKSFHGVEASASGRPRRLLQYSILVNSPAAVRDA